MQRLGARGILWEREVVGFVEGGEGYSEGDIAGRGNGGVLYSQGESVHIEVKRGGGSAVVFVHVGF